MKNKDVLLVKTLLKSTSGLNVLKYSTDKKKKGNTIGTIIGFSILYIFLIAYGIFTAIGYAQAGLIDRLPMLTALTVSLMAFFFTILKVNGYLFNFKEYDMLMAMPFSIKTIAASRFSYMYVKSLPWYLCIEVSMLIGYACFAKPDLWFYIVWILLSMLLPVIPMVFATLIGYAIARVGSGFKQKKLVQTILTLAFVILCIFSNFIFEAIFKDGDGEKIVEDIASLTGSIADYYLPAKWFCNAVGEFKVADILLLTGASIALFEALFYLISGSYRKINSSLMSSSSTVKMKTGDIKKRSIVNTIAYKEFRRLLGSTLYITNAGVGEIMAAILGIVGFIVNADVLIGKMFAGAPINREMLLPAIPFIIYLFLGMVPTTACSPSLEGRNYWIIQSMPIDKWDLYKGKMLFNMYFTVPFMLLGTIGLCVSARAGIANTVLYIVTGFVLCAFSTTWGCVCGIKHMRLDWENEVEVIKQGTAITVYLLPNMIATMALLIGVVELGNKYNQTVVVSLITLLAALLALLCGLRVKALSGK